MAWLPLEENAMTSYDYEMSLPACCPEECASIIVYDYWRMI